MTYLASPFYDLSPATRYERVILARRAVEALLERGERVYSPIACAWNVFGDVHWESEARWKLHGLDMLGRCDAFAVLLVDGWRASHGCAEEWRWWTAHRAAAVGWFVITADAVAPAEPPATLPATWTKGVA